MVHFPNIDAPVAIMEPVAPISVFAIKHKTAKCYVIAAFKRVRDRTAIQAVLCPALQIRIENIHRVFAQITVETPIAIFAVKEIIAKRIFVIHLMHKNAGNL